MKRVTVEKRCCQEAKRLCLILSETLGAVVEEQDGHLRLVSYPSDEAQQSVQMAIDSYEEGLDRYISIRDRLEDLRHRRNAARSEVQYWEGKVARIAAKGWGKSDVGKTAAERLSLSRSSYDYLREQVREARE